MTRGEMMPNGFIFYHGPSELDGESIVGIATGLERSSANVKTGGMIQTYILRADISPIEARQTKHDRSICGDCLHADHGTCYVNLIQGPTSVWNTYKRGRYANDWYLNYPSQAVRLGTYGDPCAIPFYIWANLLHLTEHVTGYTHQWKNPRFSDFKQFCMASCDNLHEKYEAESLGWRTFTVLPSYESYKLAGSLLCPASAEAGHKLTCEKCLACGGLSSQNTSNVHIPVHGLQFKKDRFSNLIQIGE